MPDWWSWNPLDWLNAILTVPFCGMMFIVLALVFGVVAYALTRGIIALANWMDRKTLQENAKPIKVVKYEPPQAIGTALEGFQSVKAAQREIVADRSVLRQAEDVIEAYQKKGDAA